MKQEEKTPEFMALKVKRLTALANLLMRLESPAQKLTWAEALTIAAQTLQSPPPQSHDTETLLIASLDEAKIVVKELQAAIKTVERSGTMAYARATVGHPKGDGPWGLSIGVAPGNQ